MKLRSNTDPLALLPGLADYLALIKFRLLALVLVSTCMGYFIGATADTPLTPLVLVLLGITLVGGGANTLNQWKERHADALMYRTRLRPLPARRLMPENALWFGSLISLCGFALIAAGVNTLTLVLSLLSWASYLFVYTPLKTRSVLNTWAGAIPGAIPAVLGCTAAAGTLNASALALFLVLYIWQMPHFFAISWVYRDDYLRGGFRMLSWNDENGSSTARHILLHTVLLLPAGAGLYWSGYSGQPYLWFALLNGAAFLVLALRFWHERSKARARAVFHYSIVYLPLLFLGIIVDSFLR